MITIEHIDPGNKTSLAHFYDVGRAIRKSLSFQEIDWNDDHGLDQLIGEPNVALYLVTAKSENGMGRIAAIKFDNDVDGIIGWYECAQAPEVSKALLDAATEFLKKKGCQRATGPINGSTWNNYRFNKTCDYPLLPGEPYQPLYYVSLWEKYGFKEHATYQSDIAPSDLFEPMTMAEGRELAKQFNLSVDYYPTNPGEDFLDKMYAFYHACFEGNPLFQPIDREAYGRLSTKFEKILNVEHSLLVRDREDNPIAVLLSYKDIYHHYYITDKIKDSNHAKSRLFIKTIATHPDWQGKQIGTLMVNLVHNLANETGYEEIYHLLMYQDNLSATKGKEKFVTKKVREYAIYSIEL